MSNILKQYRVAGEDKNVRVINSNSMIKQIFADSISRPADSYTGISSDAQSSLGKQNRKVRTRRRVASMMA